MTKHAVSMDDNDPQNAHITWMMNHHETGFVELVRIATAVLFFLDTQREKGHAILVERTYENGKVATTELTWP